MNLWGNVLNNDSGVTEKPSAADMYAIWRSARLEKMVIEDGISSLVQELAKDYKIAIVTQLFKEKRSQHQGLTDCSKLS